MIKKSKRPAESADNAKVSVKKAKFESAPLKKSKKPLKNAGKSKKPSTGLPKKPQQPPIGNQEKPNWMEIKKQKKELKVKRKQTNVLYDVITEAKKIAELLRQKKLKSDKTERSKLVLKLHSLLGGKGHYSKLVLSHDMARVVQYLLKFGPQNVREEVAKEILPLTVEMLQSKYGRYCLKCLLKYGSTSLRSMAINKMYGHAVKLTSHVVSASIFEYAYSTWASPQQKQHLIQEFFGDMYKQSKDDNVRHLRDVYKDSASMKTAALSATKGNLSRILNKDLLDSALIQSVLYQYLSECTQEDRAELISQLASHVAILSNSKDGARVAMMCIWHGSNKDRKVAMKTIKEHAVDLSKHEHAHCTVIALLDATDDTVLLNKMILTQILADVKALVIDEWGRKVLLWLVAPADSTNFHPLFIKELEAGREASSSKKTPDVRRKELLDYSSSILLESIAEDADFWLSSASLSMVTLAILKCGAHDNLAALKSVVTTIVKPNWKITDNETDILGIEHPGLHMILKRLAQHDKGVEKDCVTFGKVLLDLISDDTIQTWLTLNRGCFVLITVYENANDLIQKSLVEKLQPHLDILKKQKTTGAKILLKKLK